MPKNILAGLSLFDFDCLIQSNGNICTCFFSQYFSICLDSTDDDEIVIEDSKDIITVKQMMKPFANHPMLESFQLC